jgi:hypothetical protein
MDSAFNQPTSTTPRRNWQPDQCYREGCKLERELAAVTEQRDEFRGLLIELYNDINVIHSGKAVSKLNKLFRDENYN